MYLTAAERTNRIVEFYEHAAADFPRWSRGSNIHFGYWRRGIDPRDLEAMLEQMNLEVAERLALPPGPAHVLDLGCGYGSTARAIARRYPRARVTGLTVVERQVGEGNRQAAEGGLEQRVEVRRHDFHDLGVFEAVDGACSIEAFCYAHPHDQAHVLAELARALRPGARFVLADAFVPHDRSLGPVSRRLHAALADGWRLPGLLRLPEVLGDLRAAGFSRVDVEDVSWRVAPSLLHVPARIAGMRTRVGPFRRLASARRANALTPLLGLVTAGLGPADLRYLLVTAER